MDQDINFNTNISTGPFDSNEKNNLSSECQEEEGYTAQKRFTRTTLYLLAMTISLLGNSAVIMIVRKNRRNEKSDALLDCQHGSGGSAHNNLLYALQTANAANKQIRSYDRRTSRSFDL